MNKISKMIVAKVHKDSKEKAMNYLIGEDSKKGLNRFHIEKAIDIAIENERMLNDIRCLDKVDKAFIEGIDTERNRNKEKVLRFAHFFGDTEIDSLMKNTAGKPELEARIAGRLDILDKLRTKYVEVFKEISLKECNNGKRSKTK
jgi:hypothetical protein